MPSTLLLDPKKWDLLVDGQRNIAVASEPYALAQDAGSAICLFEGEDYYDTTRGVPYWAQILGKYPPVRVMKAAWVTAALTVPNVIAAVCFISSFVDRIITGQVLVTGADGQTAAIPIKPPVQPIPPPNPPPGNFPSYDFSKSSNSMYLPR